MPRLPLGDWVDSAVDFLQNHFAWLFDAIGWVVSHLYDAINAVLSAPEPLLLAGIFAVLAWWMRSLSAGLLAFVGFALIDSMELWAEAMETLSLVLVATIVVLAIAMPLGIWAARSKTVSSLIRPVLDLMQTMPAMVYLIPGVVFFGIGAVPGIIATIIFALPPGVRMTELGIRQVDAELVEAAEAFGTTPRNTLLRVQLPLALQTIMAGINQVIMLGLSMVVIAGMVGGGGLGGAVYRALGNIDVGLGFEAGLSVVILAVYLDRITGALSLQVSPVGRRILAKAKEAAGGLKIWQHRPQPVVAIAGVLVLALVAGGIGLFGGSSSSTSNDAGNVGQGKKISMGYIPWDEGIASTFLWKELLEQRGYEVDARQYEAGSLYTGQANGQIDIQTDSWLPVTHASYWAKYKDDLEDMGAWYDKTSLELSVPSYVKGVNSLADLKGKSSTFKGRIIGIEPSAGEMGLLKDKVLKAYGLDKEYKLVDGSTSGMLAELKRAYAKKEPVVVVLWSPHWAYDTYDLTKLADPKKAFGAESDGVHTLARKGFSEDNPQVGSWLKNFKMDEKQLTSLEAEIQKAGQGKEQDAVRTWLKANPGLADKWTPVEKSGASGKGETERALNVAWFPWEEDIAATYLWKAVLEERGYKVNLKQFELGPMYEAMSRGQIDVQFDAWLPNAQKRYWDKYKNDLTQLGSWYGPTTREVAVPSYVKGVESLDDLKGRGGDFQGRIVGIEPGTEQMNVLKEDVVPGYGLGGEYKVVDSSTPGMLAELKRAYAKKEPIAVSLWSPHWAYKEYELTKLKDPKKAFGDGDRLTTVAHKSFTGNYPQLTKWFKNFKLSEEQLSGLENEIQKAGTGHEEEAVKTWMGENPGIADKMAPV
ncbi:MULTISPECIES: ABC transporter permease/substrate binding protein [unclassified Streptomyces]|uniref:ABC transporter permease/substrate binding protein n=1 Tax=unclassified Streptomyces TaxID=2593676 RepID=UPI002E794E4C|nr:ABC transporter permease/substrate binding protein [Streptomyces sp. JV176]MEE1800091.1 ABC transporter permease/substrate binding protein [Streptomyces sp. JV176]